MEIVKQQFIKIWHGVLYGIGMFIGLGALAFAFTNVTFNASNQFERFEYSSDAGLEVYEVSNGFSASGFYIIGILNNSGNDAWQDTFIQIEFFDQEGQFIDECNSYVKEISRPDDGIHFKLTCYSIEEDTFDSYTVRIIDSRHKRTS